MHVLTGVSLPAHDEKTDAILLYSEEIVTVQGNGKIHRVTRNAYRILRPGGVGYGTVVGISNSQVKLLSMHGWCIPASGKDIEVKDKDAVESSAPAVAHGELVSEVRAKVLKIPESEPGNIVGSEVEQEESLFVMQDGWDFQERVPVREARYTLQLPAGWEYKAKWVHAPEIKPAATGTNQWQWVVSDVTEIRHETDMPPWRGVAGQMIVSLIPPDGARKGFVTWPEMGKWTATLAQGKRNASPEVKQKVAELTADKKTTVTKMIAIAEYVQSNIRYVAIELGIGGWQPHGAKDIYGNQYGDCKDKATLMSSMLKEIGVDSDYLVVNTHRGAVNPEVPIHGLFNHAILAIHLPDDVNDAALEAIYSDKSAGRLLIFDPTDDLTPFGHLRGALQGSYGLLVTADSGELIELPIFSPQDSGIRRGGKFILTATGTLSGEVVELRYGDFANFERNTYRYMTRKEDQVKPIETMLSRSVGTYQIAKASIGNLDLRDAPFQLSYTFVAPDYAKTAGELLLVRPRVLGEKSSDLLEKKEARKYPVEFEGPRRDVDRIEISLPVGYQVDELPPAADVDYAFGSYHSKTELHSNALVYTRTFEIKNVSVPLEQMDELKKFYRIIASDERGTAVLKPAAH
ncbi:MAG TPA: DUF3857 domain-containing protein [Verrucomicrobiae bacterium]|nr:DUF3857 domain-containing protein [Verrucomicrobiae bacterium]